MSFLIIGAAVFFLVVKPVNTLMDVVLLGEIRDLLKAR